MLNQTKLNLWNNKAKEVQNNNRVTFFIPTHHDTGEPHEKGEEKVEG